MPARVVARTPRGPRSSLADEYEKWIKKQSQIDVGGGRRGKTRDKLMQRAGAGCDRIRSGVERMCSDPEAFEAFVLANRAMALAARQRSPSRYVDAVPKWRLFQLAFVRDVEAGVHLWIARGRSLGGKT